MADDMTPMERVVVAEHERRQAVQRAEQAEDRLRAVSGEYARLRERADDTEAARARWQKRGEEAEAERDALKAATDRVRALHKPLKHGGLTICSDCSGWTGRRCIGLVRPHPCPTLAALDHPPDTTGETETP